MIAIDIFVGIAGLALGSFIYTTAIRLQNRESLWQRSRCPLCGKPVGIVGLLPVLGYVVQLGKCLRCKGKISVCYPLLEITNGGIVYLIYLKTGWSTEFFHYVPVFEVLWLIAILDFKTHLIFPQPIVAGLLFQTAWLLFGERDQIIGALAGLCIGAGVFHWIAFLYRSVRNRTGLGDGDATVLGFIGYVFGWDLLFPTIFWAALMGIIGGTVILRIKKQSLRSEIAFGPWLIASIFLVWYQGGIFLSFPFTPPPWLVL